jgi:hypothetical protein
MTTIDLLQGILGAKIIESGANLTVPKSPKDGTLPRAVLHGWAKVEIAGKTIKFSENRNAATIKRRLLDALEPGTNLNALRARVLRDAFDAFVVKVKDAAGTAAEKRKQAEGPKIEEKIHKLVQERKEREKRAGYAAGCVALERLFRGPLFDMGGGRASRTVPIESCSAHYGVVI